MSGMKRLQRVFVDAGGALGHPSSDSLTLESSEQVYISSLTPLKMLKHGRAGVPMEAIGLMLGEFIDEYTVRAMDVFAMPRSGTGVSVEAMDHAFQTNMFDILKQTGRGSRLLYELTKIGWSMSKRKRNGRMEYLATKIDPIVEELIISDIKEMKLAAKKLIKDAAKLEGLGFGTSFLKWVASFSAM